MTSKKRRYDRIGSLNLLYYACLDDTGNVIAQGMGRTLNVSEGGIMLETHEPIPTSQILLTIGFKEDVAEVKGKVVYSKKEDDDHIKTGIEFIETDEDPSGVIKRYIDAFSRQSDKSSK